MDPIPGFRSIWLSGIMLAATSIALIDTTQADTGFGKSCRNTSYLKQQVTEVLGEGLKQFHLRSFDAQAFVSRGVQKSLRLSLPDENNQLVDLNLTVRTSPTRISGLTKAFLKSGKTRVRGLRLPPEISFQLGPCTKSNPTCGNLVVVGRQVEGIVINKSIGFALFEPVQMLMKRHGMEKWRGDPDCHILYNANFHAPLSFIDIPGDKQSSRTARQDLRRIGNQVVYNLRRSIESVGNLLIQPANAMLYPIHIPIALDSDAAFYSLDPATVWSRQLSIIHSLNLIYGLIEPLSNGYWSIIFDVQSQESWLPGHGPTTTEGTELSEKINAEDYYMVHHPDNDGISFFFVGKDMNLKIGSNTYYGVYGVSVNSGFCPDVKVDQTFDSVPKHHHNHVWGQQVKDLDGGTQFATLLGRVIGAAHEIGHMLGATHPDGCSDMLWKKFKKGVNCCAAGSLSGMCGTSIMPEGGMGDELDFRKPFFTSAASKAIRECVSMTY